MLLSGWARNALLPICILVVAAVCFATQTVASPSEKKPAPKHSHQAATSSKHKNPSKNNKSKKTASKRGQQKIDPQRARQIQQALVREHYLSGEPSGVWDAASEQAMQKFQADNGWQDKTTPDSRALIKLGLGPNHEHLLNPETAMTAPRAQADPPTASPSAGPAGKSPQ